MTWLAPRDTPSGLPGPGIARVCSRATGTCAAQPLVPSKALNAETCWMVLGLQTLGRDGNSEVDGSGLILSVWSKPPCGVIHLCPDCVATINAWSGGVEVLAEAAIFLLLHG